MMRRVGTWRPMLWSRRFQMQSILSEHKAKLQETRGCKVQSGGERIPDVFPLCPVRNLLDLVNKGALHWRLGVGERAPGTFDAQALLLCLAVLLQQRKHLGIRRHGLAC